MAGASPKPTLVSSVTPSKKTITEKSRPMVSTRGMLAGLSATNTRVPHDASHKPKEPPKKAEKPVRAPARSKKAG